MGVNEFYKGYQSGTDIDKDGRGDLVRNSHSILAGRSNIFLHLLNKPWVNVWLTEIQ
jgi:hypothetical protein